MWPCLLLRRPASAQPEAGVMSRGHGPETSRAAAKPSECSAPPSGDLLELVPAWSVLDHLGSTRAAGVAGYRRRKSMNAARPAGIGSQNETSR
jgi:hypothetical protein